jgi:phage portal protein BeeE
METALDAGLGLNNPKEGRRLGVELDLDQLLRMDSATMIDVLGKGVGAGIVSPDEARKRLEYGSVKGGKSPYLQQQNFSLAALAERDANQPFAKPAAAPAPDATPPPDEPPPDDQAAANDDEAQTRELVVEIRRRFAHGHS